MYDLGYIPFGSIFPASINILPSEIFDEEGHPVNVDSKKESKAWGRKFGHFGGPRTFFLSKC